METPNSRRPRTPRRGRQLRRCPTHAPDLALLDQPLRGRPTLRQHPRNGLLQAGHGCGPAKAHGLPHVPVGPARPTVLACQRATPYGRCQRGRVAKLANVHFDVFVDTTVLQQGAPLLKMKLTVDLIYYCVLGMVQLECGLVPVVPIGSVQRSRTLVYNLGRACVHKLRTILQLRSVYRSL